MDAADLKTIQDFTDVPFTVEASASAADYMARASSMLAGQRMRLNTEGMDNVPYRKALADIRKQVEAAFAYDDRRVEFFDLSEKQPIKEAIRIDLTLAKSAAAMTERGRKDEAFTVETKDSFDKPLCVVVGPMPSMTAKQYFTGGSNVVVSTAGVDDEAMQRVAMWHELGHCMLGPSDAAADVFAALMEIRHTKSGKVIPLLASFREFEELTSPSIADDKLISPTLWSLNKIEAKIRKSKKFKEMSLKDVASLATEIVSEYGPGKDQKAHAKRFRAAVNGIVAMKAHFAHVADGMQPISAEQWMDARAKDIPEFARLRSVVSNIKRGASSLAPQNFDGEAFAGAMERLAKSGDPTADAFLGFYRDPESLRTVASPALDARVGLRQIDASAGETIKFDRKNERISFGFDNDVWQITNAETGEFVRSGSVSLGCQWAMADYPKFNPTAQMAFGY
jgi:hypothetical protein